MKITHKKNLISINTNNIDFYVEANVELQNFDFCILLCLLKSIYDNQDLIIDYPITKELYFNIQILSEYLVKYLNLKPILIKAENLIETNPINDKVLIPFSGGIDSCFTLFHSKYILNKKIDSAIHIFGLDLSDENEYKKSTERCTKILNSVEANIITVKTDIRKQFGAFTDWRLQSDIILGGLLHLFDYEFGQAFISGGGDGGKLTIAQCFNTPFLNERLFHLFSNPSMQIDNYVGESYTRIQKLEYISKFPIVRSNLRVCWAGAKSENCGKCINCVTTQLGFLAAIDEIPSCFNYKITIEDVNRMIKIMEQPYNIKDFDADPLIISKRFNEISLLSGKTSFKNKLIQKISNIKTFKTYKTL